MNAEDMWKIFCKNNNLNNKSYEAWAFGDKPDELAELVLQGIKTATSSLYALYDIEQEPLPKEGDYGVILNSHGDARCIIKTTRVYVVPFNKVSETHAYREGEGDRSLTYWREVHKEFFVDSLKETQLSFHAAMDVVCEEFEVVYR